MAHIYVLWYSKEEAMYCNQIVLLITSLSLLWVSYIHYCHTFIATHLSLYLSTALPAPVVSISPYSGSPTAGQTYSLTCSVQVVAHLMVEPSIEWTRQDGTVLNASSGYSLQLSFNPLMISNISLYTCRAIANISYVISNTGEASLETPLSLALYSPSLALHCVQP